MSKPVVVVVNGQSEYIDKTKLVKGEGYSKASKLKSEIEAWKLRNEQPSSMKLKNEHVSLEQVEKNINRVPDYHFKYVLMSATIEQTAVLCGNGGGSNRTRTYNASAPVGKTQLFNAFTGKRFSHQYEFTHGSNYASRIVDIDGNAVEVQIWDLNLKLNDSSWWHYETCQKQADVAFFLFDVNNAKTFEGLGAEIDDASIPDGCIKILVGTKIDKENQRVVTRKRAEAFAQEKGMANYIDISSKEGTNVNELLMVATRTAIAQKRIANEASAKQQHQQELPFEDNIHIENERKPSCNLTIPQPWRLKKDGISTRRAIGNSAGLALGIGSVVAGIVGLATMNPVAAVVAGVVAGAVAFLASAAIQLLINNKINREGFFKMPKSPIKLQNSPLLSSCRKFN